MESFSPEDIAIGAEIDISDSDDNRTNTPLKKQKKGGRVADGGKSAVWDHFTYLSIDNKSKCKFYHKRTVQNLEVQFWHLAFCRQPLLFYGKRKSSRQSGEAFEKSSKGTGRGSEKNVGKEHLCCSKRGFVVDS